MIDGATAVAAEDTEAMRIVEDREAAVFFGDLRNLGEAGDVALHGINAFDDQHLGRVAVSGGEGAAEVFGTVVGEALDGRHGEPDAVPETRVNVFIGEDDVALLGEGGDA